MTFLDLQRRIMRQTRLNPAWFARTVTYTRGESPDELNIHVRHRESIEEQSDGTTKVWDTIDVEIDTTDLDQAPDFGDRIQLADEPETYLFAYQGKHRLVSWKATFRRQRVTSQGTRGER